LFRISKANLHSFGRAYPFTGYEIDPNGVITKFISVGGESLASRKGATQYFYHNDHLGSVNVVTNLAGAQVQLIEYDPWGAVSKIVGTIDPDTRFTGQKLDPETGLYYYGGRYYDAEIGRFISADPFVQTPFDPQNLNRYSYVINNPQNYIDPDGYFHIHKKKKPGFFQRFFGFFVGAIVGWFTGGAGFAIAEAIGFASEAATVIGGIIGGAVGSAVNAAISGGDPGRAALFGAFSGGGLAYLGYNYGYGSGGSPFGGSGSFGAASGPGIDHVFTDGSMISANAGAFGSVWGSFGVRQVADEERQLPLRFGVPRSFRISLSRPDSSHILGRGHGRDWGNKRAR
jgi:RHS repeat-associated protein